MARHRALSVVVADSPSKVEHQLLRELINVARRYAATAAVASEALAASTEAVEMAPREQAADEAAAAAHIAGREDVAAYNVLRACLMFARVSPGAGNEWPQLTAPLVVRQPGVAFTRRGRAWAEVVEVSPFEATERRALAACLKYGRAAAAFKRAGGARGRKQELSDVADQVDLDELRPAARAYTKDVDGDLEAVKLDGVKLRRKRGGP